MFSRPLLCPVLAVCYVVACPFFSWCSADSALLLSRIHVHGAPKSPLKAGTQRPNGRSPKNALNKGEKPTLNCVRKTVGTWSCMITADRPHVDELQLRHQHCFLHCLNHNTVVAQQRARRQTPKNCTWRISGLLHSLHCGYMSLQHNRNVPHSGDELDLRHRSNSLDCRNLSLMFTGTSTTRGQHPPQPCPVFIYRPGLAVNQSGRAHWVCWVPSRHQ